MAKLFEMRNRASARLAELGVDETAASITGRYSLGQTLGEGRFSQVVAATCVRTGADVALKAMALAEVTDDKEPREMLAQEVAVLRRANGCQGVVGLREVVATPETLYLVLTISMRGAQRLFPPALDRRLPRFHPFSLPLGGARGPPPCGP